MMAALLLLLTTGVRAQLITTMAGTGIAGHDADGGPATNAQFNRPTGICIDLTGFPTPRLFIADSVNNLVRMVDLGTLGNPVTTYAGGGTTGLGDGGLAIKGQLNHPTSVSADGFGNIYIADIGNSRIRKVNSTGIITTVVNTKVTTPYGGYAGPGVSALTPGSINNAYGVKASGGGYYIADRDNNIIQYVNTAGIINTVAGIPGVSGCTLDGGPATVAEFDHPSGLVADGSGSLYIADRNNNVIRKVTTTYQVSTIAGTRLQGNTGDGGPATAATFRSPSGLAISGSRLYISDMGNNRIRYMDLITQLVYPVAGDDISAIGSTGTADGTGGTARFNTPMGICLNTAGSKMYVADKGNNIIREIDLGSNNVTTIAGSVAGFLGDGGPATAARFTGPQGVAMHPLVDDYLIVADAGNNRVRKITFITGSIASHALSSGGTGYAIGDLFTVNTGTTLATGIVNTVVPVVGTVLTYTLTSPGNGYAAGPAVATTATTGVGTGLTIDIISFVPGITTIGGNGGTADPSTGNDGIPAVTAQIPNPTNVVLDLAGNIYVTSTGTFGVPNTGNRVRVINAGSGVIDVYAGNKTGAYLGDGVFFSADGMGEPEGITFNAAGDMFIAATADNRIRWAVNSSIGHPGYTSGLMYTYAGNGIAAYGAKPDVLEMRNPTGITINSVGDIYIADRANHVVRKFDSKGAMSVVAGGSTRSTVSSGFSGDGLMGGAKYAQLNAPTAVAYHNVSNSLYIADEFNNVVRKVDMSTGPLRGTITTYAGTPPPALPGYAGDGGLATAAQLFNVTGVDVDQLTGDLYIADQINNRIRKVDYGTKIITTVAGTGVAGYLSSGGPATAAMLDQPYSVASDTFGNTFIADRNNHIIRRVDRFGVISTYAGTGKPGFSGDAGPATAAQLSGPSGVSLDQTGNLYIADQANNRIRKVDAVTKVMTTIAGIAGTPGFADGSTTTAKFYYPTSVASDRTGANIFVADGNNNRIRKITGATVSTFAGSAFPGYGPFTGSPTAAKLNDPKAVCVNWTSGDVYIADFLNHAVHRVNSAGTTIATVAGTGPTSTGFSGDGGPATAASVQLPSGVALDATGNLFISDFGNTRVRRVDFLGNINSVAGNGTIGYSGDGGQAVLAQLNNPFGLSVDTTGSLYIADRDNHAVRKVTAVLLAKYSIPDSALCQDSCVLFTNTSIGTTDSIRWMIAPTGPSIVNSAADTTTMCFATPGIYAVTLHIYYKGKDSFATKTVTVSARPVPTITQSGLTLSTYAGYGSYQWYNGTTLIPGAVINSYDFTPPGGTYRVVIDSNGCTGEATITPLLPWLNVTTVNDVKPENKYWLTQSANDNNMITLYAGRPIDDQLAVTMYDATGRAILNDKWSKGGSQLQIKAASIAPGIYIIKLTNHNTSEVLKWIKN